MSFDKECELTNAYFHKNKKYEVSEYWRYEIAYPEIVSRIPFMFKALQISKRAFSSSGVFRGLRVLPNKLKIDKKRSRSQRVDSSIFP